MWKINEIRNNIKELGKKEMNEENYFELMQYYDMLGLNNNLTLRELIKHTHYKKKFFSYKTFDNKIDKQLSFYKRKLYLIEDVLDELLNIELPKISNLQNEPLDKNVNLCKDFYEGLNIISKEKINDIFDNKIEIIMNPYTFGKTYFLKNNNSHIHFTYFKDNSLLSSYILTHEIGHLISFENKNYEEYVDIYFSPFLETLPMLMELLFDMYLNGLNNEMHAYHSYLNLSTIKDDYSKVLKTNNKYEYVTCSQRLYSTILAYYLYDMYLGNPKKLKNIILNLKDKIGKLEENEILGENNIDFKNVTIKNYVKKYINNN